MSYTWSAVARVELAGRLVGEEDLGPVRERGAERDALLLAARELGRVARSRLSARPTRSSSSSARRRRSRGAVPRRPSCSATSSRARQLGGERARVVLVGVAEQCRAVRRRAAARGSLPRSSPCTRTTPADGRSSPASSRSSVDLPEPLGPSTVSDLPLFDGQRQPLQRGGVAFGRRVDAEDVASARSRRHAAASDARAGDAPARRVSRARRAAPASATYATAAAASERQIERRAAAAAPARAALAVTETSEMHERRQDRRRAASPPASPEGGDERARAAAGARAASTGAAPCASRSNSSPRSSRTSPTTAEQQAERAPAAARRAAVPASVSSAPRASGSARSRASVSARDCTCSSLNGARASAARSQPAARRHVSQSSFVVPSPRRARVERSSRRLAVGDDGVADDGREAVDDADDARRDLLALDLSGTMPRGPAAATTPGVASTRSGDAVGRLDGPERADAVRSSGCSRAAPARRRRRPSRSSA